MAIPNDKYDPSVPGRVVIIKQDFWDIYDAITSQQQVRLTPPLVWVDAATVRIEATAYCPAETMFTGMPNILNLVTTVSGGLSDNKRRAISSNISCLFASGGLYGAEKSSQWYAILATAADADADFDLRAMPWLRVKSQASRVISLGTNLDPSVDIGYAFTANEFIGGMIYFISGASKGLMRPIIANSNGATVPGTIEYSGAALSVAQDDWFIILPPTNFRWLGDIFNTSSGDIQEFSQDGNMVSWLADNILLTPGATALCEDIRAASPLAISMGVMSVTDVVVAHPDYSAAGTGMQFGDSASMRTFVEVGIRNCQFRAGGGGSAIRCYWYKYAG